MSALPAAQQAQATAASVPLAAWIQRALGSLDGEGSQAPTFATTASASSAVASDAYLLPALRVARSLAGQCGRAAEENEASSSSLPAPGSDWAKCAMVHIAASGQGQKGESQQQQQQQQQPAYLSVEGARFSPTSSSHHGHDGSGGDNKGRRMDEAHIIHALGLVFYEIFSGGEKPPVAPGGGSDDANDNNCKDGKRAQGQLWDIDGHLPASIDFGSALHIDRLVDDVLGESAEENTGRNTKRMALAPQPATTASISTEPLRPRGLPQNLCHLIGDMLDGANRDLVGDESYNNLSDVVSDLDLMLEKPDRFLHDLDAETLSREGLQLHEQVFGREAELSTLKESYARAVAGASEMAIISGLSGTGKSVLAHRLGSHISSSGGIFIEGKFDQLRQSTPFTAIAVAFNDYCGDLIWEAPRTSQELANKLTAALGGDVHHLARVIPNLGAMLGDATDGIGSGNDQDCVNPQQRFLYLFCQFVGIVSLSSGAPVTLFLDDCHWADPSSIEAIKHLLLVSGSMESRFYFVGCCREEEINGDHPFGSMLTQVRCFGVNDTWVNLKGMEEATVNSIISDLLQLSPRLTRPLSNVIYQKTGGIPIFFSRLLLKLSQDGLLRLSLSRRRWEWDEEQIQSQQLPDDVASIFIKNINGLPSDVQLALRTLSCFGARTAVSLITCLERKLGTPLLKPLDKAVHEGLVVMKNNSYYWAHDRIQATVYDMIGPIAAPVLRFNYGIALTRDNDGNVDDDTLFAALGQINFGGPEVAENAQQSLLIAKLNLLVGKKAMSQSDFRLAYSFFDHGINFLRKGHWKEQYTLSLELFDCAAKSAFAISDFASVRLVTDQVLRFGRSFESKLEALYITVNALTCEFRLPESIETCLGALSELGEPLPQPMSSSDVKSFVARTQLVLVNITDEHLLSYKKCSDESKMWVMKFYWKLQITTLQARPNLQPTIILKLVSLTLHHGMSSVSPVGFVYFGMLLSKLGNIADGYRYVKLARRLLATVESQEVAGEVILVGTQIASFVEPLQTAIESHDQGYTASMATGDVNNAMFNCGFRQIALFWSGAKLQLMQEDFDNTRKRIGQNKHMRLLVLPLERAVLSLMGTTEVDGDAMPVAEGEAAVLESTSLFHKIVLSFIFRQYDQTKGAAEQYFAAGDFISRSWTINHIVALQSFIGGLVSFWIYRQTHEESWAERGRKAKLELEKWSESSPWNFDGKKYLLEAEESFSHNDIGNARVAYDKAISCSEAHRFIHDEALANELAGYCFLQQQGQTDICLGYFLKAHARYHEWGATAKSDALFAFVQSTLGGAPPTA